MYARLPLRLGIRVAYCIPEFLTGNERKCRCKHDTRTVHRMME